MFKFLKEAFWRDEFIVTAQQIERILSHFDRPVSTEELAEFFVREVLENEQEFSNARVYSPEQDYAIGERLIFIHKEGPKYAEVIKIVPAGSHEHEYGTYKNIYVRFKDRGEWRIYVSSCPKFPVRFSQTGGGEGDEGFEGPPITPGQIVMRFHELILVEVKRALEEDGRFIHYTGEWYPEAWLVTINLDLVENLLKETKRPLPADAILAEIFPRKEGEDLPGYRFSLNFTLEKDPKHRFARLEREGRLLWTLQDAVPPERSRYTVTEMAIKQGYIEIRPGFNQMLEFYELGPKIVFIVFGDYEIEGEIDDVTKRVYGGDIAAWYRENEVRPGDIVYIKAPEPGRKNLRLYTEHQEHHKERSPEEVKCKIKRIWLRHRIYKIFREREEFMHYKEMAELLSESVGTEISPKSVETTLSQEKHLFGRLEHSRGLWGLREWLARPDNIKIDMTSLLLDIGELQLVYMVLKQNSRPMHGREIAEEIAGTYRISPKLLMEANFIDPRDSRLLLLRNGKWGLREWQEEWKQRLHQIEKDLERIEELTRVLHEQKLRLSQVDHGIDELQNLVEKKEALFSSLKEQDRQLRNQVEKIAESIRHKQENLEALLWEEEQTVAQMEGNRAARRKPLFLALLGSSSTLVVGLLGYPMLAVLFGAISGITATWAARIHSKYLKASSSSTQIGLRKRSAEEQLARVIEEKERLGNRIEITSRAIEKIEEGIAQEKEKLIASQKSRESTEVAIDSAQEAISRYNRDALLAEKEQLAELLGEVFGRQR